MAIVSSALIAAGCHTPAASSGSPALLASASPQCHAQIEHAVSLSTGAPISLAPTVFTHDAKLFIEHAQPRDAAGRRLDGRSLERPRIYRLIKAAGKCMLIDESKSARDELDACSCRPIE